MKKWESYEQVATYLLNQCSKEFGLTRVEGKQLIKGLRTGTNWNIDAKGIKEKENEAFVIIECRRYITTKQNQEHLGGLAYRIIDTGASGGIIVSPIGNQKGAKKIASAENIIEVQLDPHSTPDDFVMKFFDKLKIGRTSSSCVGAKAEAEVLRNCRICGEYYDPIDGNPLCPKCR